MADNFTAEKTDSGDQIFATDQNATSSVHYPIGKIAWGALNTFNVTDTSSPFPVRLWGNDSAAPVHITTDSGAPPTVAVSGYVAPSTTVTVTNIAANDTVVTVTQNSSSTPTFVTTDSGAPPLVAVSGYVAPSTTVTVTNPTDSTVTVTGYVAPSTTVTAAISGGNASVTIAAITTTTGGGAIDSTNSAIRVNVVAGSAAGDTTVTATISGSVSIGESDSNGPVFAEGDTAGTARGMALTYESNSGTNSFSIVGIGSPLPVQMVTNPVTIASSGGDPLHIATDTSSAAVTASNPFPTITQAADGAVGAIVAQTFDLSSLAQTVMTEVGRLYHISVSNPDTADDVWIKVFEDDSAGVTLGTTAASISQMVPFGGGREMPFPVGVRMSSGMSVAAAATAPSTAHDTPGGTVTMTVYYAPST